MRSAVLVEFGKDLAVESLEPLPPGPRDVVVAVGASGICHTDLSVRDGLFPGMVSGPMIGGHEGAGTVIEAGDQVTRVAVGDRVIASFRPACGACPYCVHDRSHLCDALGPFLRAPRAIRHDGSHAVAMSGIGTFSDVLTCDEASVVRVASDLPDAHLALLGCGMTTGVGAALFTARVHPGSTVAVVGCGGVGQSVIQGAVIAGAARIIAVDPVESKRRIARGLGATDTVDPATAPAEEQVKELLRGRGVDYAFDVVGAPEIVASTYRMIGKGGTLVLVGYGPMDSEFRAPSFDLQANEKTVKGCVAGSAQVRRHFQLFVDLIERGRLTTEALVSQQVRLDEINVAMKAMLSGEVIRSVITTF
ncbi:S-(hydroxymethyl)glutathione dehydrogenase/alcohol dehydrogenase [Thermocatellispora tengchongensis]|uniref:S-(Hydroxymethyl)glutathione dehydrogenase/alcohol dehydrogenase n=1 Tax=Thermocatellispora tengchongensis TaxID=1073253 RepID=A0A840PAL2_9ACTN|nr:zinc-binding dehydrogenase [Thermocatellispora tengchongensis]MBB5138424.1 S-(hydroxymethyl)glutathione dehydrogenase/alcohol dehydrogenase [Thermocatellispora tengchongensis]